ncbi:MAG: amidophosphoribosyltransferase [Clostridiales bacterium]|nr:amidophosphoribosyltransferase [Clostridiales bacterium]
MENKLWLDTEDIHENLDKPQDECGVFGIYRKEGKGVVADTYHALYALQHRGQDSCGMCVNTDGVMKKYRESGLVTDVFTRDMLEKIEEGNMALGHCRYAPADMKSRSNAQPLLINHQKGSMALACNGALTNAAELRDDLEANGAIFHATADTEVIAYIITQQRLKTGSIEDAVFNAMGIIKGAYSMVVMSPTKMIACRDPHGFRPLCMGHIGDDIVFASESCALDAVGATFDRDIEAGEMIVVSKDGITSRKVEGACHDGLCVFEFVYTARPDSVVDGSSVHEARKLAGAFLAQAHPVDADVVIGVPDSGLDAALGYAQESGIPYGIGFLKNKYIGRTFILPEQKQRQDAVRIKLNAIRSTVEGKRVVMVDDSIVRGTTSAHIVNLLREAGAKEVHVRLSSPPFTNVCYFGTDVSKRETLIAANHTVEEICEIIGADSLGYLPLEACDKIAAGSKCKFCKGCFTGEYPIEPPVRKHINKYDQPLTIEKKK